MDAGDWETAMMMVGAEGGETGNCKVECKEGSLLPTYNGKLWQHLN